MSTYLQERLNENLVENFVEDRLKADESGSDDAYVTVCMPIERSGPETRQNPIRLKNCLKHAAEQAQQRGPELQDQIEQFEISSDQWESLRANPAVGLVFSRSQTIVVSLPRRWPETVVVGKSPWVRPFAQSLKEPSQALLLSLTQGQARLQRITQDAIEDIQSDEFPLSLESVVGADTESPTLQHHQQGNTTQYHGQAINRDDKEDDLHPYYRAVAHALHRVRRDLPGLESLPIFIAATEETIGEFRRVTNVDIEGMLAGSPDGQDSAELAERVRDQLKSAAASRVQERISQYQESKRGSMDLAELVAASRTARVEELVVTGHEPIWGEVHADLSVSIHPEQRSDSVDLVDVTLAHALAKGCTVRVAHEADSQSSPGPIAGLLRY